MEAGFRTRRKSAGAASAFFLRVRWANPSVQPIETIGRLTVRPLNCLAKTACTPAATASKVLPVTGDERNRGIIALKVARLKFIVEIILLAQPARECPKWDYPRTK